MSHGGPGESDAPMEHRLFVPETTGASPPLVVMLHGCTQDAHDVAVGTRFDEWAERLGFLVLYPEQQPEEHPQRCWRWFEAEHQRRGRGEPAALMALLEQVERERGVEPGRTYLAGLSAGAGMAVVLAALHPGRFAAIAAHSGVPYGAAEGEGKAEAVLAGAGPSATELSRRLREAVPTGASLPPLLAIHGTADQLVSPENTRRLVSTWLAASRDGSPEPDREVRGGEEGDGYPYLRRRWGGTGRDRVEAWLVDGLGHAWSGGSPEGTWTDPQGPDATRVVLDFFGILSRAD